MWTKSVAGRRRSPRRRRSLDSSGSVHRLLQLVQGVPIQQGKVGAVDAQRGDRREPSVDEHSQQLLQRAQRADGSQPQRGRRRSGDQQRHHIGMRQAQPAEVVRRPSQPGAPVAAAAGITNWFSTNSATPSSSAARLMACRYSDIGSRSSAFPNRRMVSASRPSRSTTASAAAKMTSRLNGGRREAGTASTPRPLSDRTAPTGDVDIRPPLDHFAVTGGVTCPASAAPSLLGGPSTTLRSTP